MKPLFCIAAILFLTLANLRADDKPSAPKGDARAAALMDEAAKTRYTWSPELTAVSGKFTWSQDGKSGAGTFRSVFHQRGGLTLTPDGDAAIPDEVKDHVGSMIGHRIPPSPAAAKRPSPAYVVVVEDDEHGPLILTAGDAMQSTQRVKDGKLVQVNRVMGGKRFTIDVTQFEKTPEGRCYPASFTVSWWDASTGKKLEKQTYTTDGLDTIAGQLFPKAEKVVSDKDGKASTLEIAYSNVKFERVEPATANK